MMPRPPGARRSARTRHRRGRGWESRPKEFHLRPLTEPCVTLSRYTAPTKWPIPPPISSEMSVALRGPPVASCLRNATTWPDPFAPVPLQDLHHYYESARPNAPLRYSRLTVFAACASPLTSEHWFLQFRAKACIRFTPSPRRSPSVQSSGTRQTCPSGAPRLWFRRRLDS
jgi:hypothetical protein